MEIILILLVVLLTVDVVAHRVLYYVYSRHREKIRESFLKDTKTRLSDKELEEVVQQISDNKATTTLCIFAVFIFLYSLITGVIHF